MSRFLQIARTLFALLTAPAWPLGACGIRSASAAPVPIANSSFESPAFTDGGYSFLVPVSLQGAYGWVIQDGAFIYNPPAIDYTGAGGSGTPSGADGQQIGGINGFGDYLIHQRLAGADEIVGTSDDPVLTPGVNYQLTLAIGQRAVGNLFGATWGGYDVRLIVGIGETAAIVLRENDAVTPAPGTFVERTILKDPGTVLDPSLYGQPLSIVLRHTISTSTATVEFDDIRLDAVRVTPLLTGDFDENGNVSSSDLDRWKTGFGGVGEAALHTLGNANGDGYVDGADVLVWQRQLLAPSGGGVAAPEPSSLWLIAIAGACLIKKPNRRHDAWMKTRDFAPTVHDRFSQDSHQRIAGGATRDLS